MSYTLLVIDMQPEFNASNNAQTLSECVKQIKRAIKHNNPVVFAEFVGFGPTHTSLTDLVKDYDRSFTFLKNSQSGAPEFENVIRHFSFHKYIKVCGVNTNQCVLHTVEDLSKEFIIDKITVISKACNSDYGHESGLSVMAGYNKVKVI